MGDWGLGEGFGERKIMKRLVIGILLGISLSVPFTIYAASKMEISDKISLDPGLDQTQIVKVIDKGKKVTCYVTINRSDPYQSSVSGISCLGY